MHRWWSACFSCQRALFPHLCSRACSPWPSGRPLSGRTATWWWQLRQSLSYTPWEVSHRLVTFGGRKTHMSPSLSCPTVSSQPGSSLAARTGEMQHMPSGFPALWKSLTTLSTSEWTVQSLFFSAQLERFFATPKPPAQKLHVKEWPEWEGWEKLFPVATV